MKIDPLPNEQQRQKLCELAATAFIEIRLYADNRDRIFDLANAFHNLPREMYGWGTWSRETFRGRLNYYQTKYRSDPGRDFDFVKIFDEIFADEQSG